MSNFFRRISPGLWLFLFFFSIYQFTMSGFIQYGDEVEKYRVAQSIVERQELSFRPTVMRAHIGVGGANYSIYELGQTLLEVPLYALGKIVYAFFPTEDANWVTQLFVGLLNPILMALTGVIFFKTCQSLGFRYPTSLGLTLTLGLATIVFPYSKSFTREPLLTALILSSVSVAYLYQKTQSPRWLLLAGISTGYLAFSKIVHILVMPIILAYLLWGIFQDSRREGMKLRAISGAIFRGMGLFLLPALLFLVLQVIYSLARFGAADRGFGTPGNPVAWIVSLISESKPGAATLGLLFSEEKSIFLYSPPAILFLIAWFYWLRTRKPEAFLFLVLIVTEFISAIVRPDWNGGSWWGPRYVVQITPLLIIPIGALLDSSNPLTRQVTKRVLATLFVMGFGIQLVGAFSNDRDFIDVMGGVAALSGQLDFLRHGMWDSLLITLAPNQWLPQINLYAVVLIAISVLCLFGIGRSRRVTQPSMRMSVVCASIILLIQFAAFLAFVVAPYPQVVSAKADTRFVAANQYFAEGANCQALGLYMIALNRGTRYDREAAQQIERLWLHVKGTRVPLPDLMLWVNSPEGTVAEYDSSVTLTGNAIKFSAPPGKDVSVGSVAQPVRVKPQTEYELSGWVRSSNIYGTGYAVVSVAEDDGNWQAARVTDIQTIDETNGWIPFRKTFVTLPTTRRLFVKAGLYETYGTFWMDDIQLTQVDPNLSQPNAKLPPCLPDRKSFFPLILNDQIKSSEPTPPTNPAYP